MSKAMKSMVTRNRRRAKRAAQGFRIHTVTLILPDKSGVDNRLGVNTTKDNPPLQSVVIDPAPLVMNILSIHFGLNIELVGNNSTIEQGDICITDVTPDPTYASLLDNPSVEWHVSGPSFNGIYSNQMARIVEDSPLSRSFWLKEVRKS